MIQTAVEWLIDQLEKKGDASVNMSIGRMQISIIEEDYVNLLEQANAIKALVDSYTDKDADAYAREQIRLVTEKYSKYILF